MRTGAEAELAGNSFGMLKRVNQETELPPPPGLALLRRGNRAE